ncbi:MAG TPA: hypothetical protein VLC79_06090 [Cellvibrio sp.]|nr:hypothetical protein [Cellvibrio sp.]
MATPPRSPKALSHLPNSTNTFLSKLDMTEYVYFSEQTKGVFGKAVKIKVDLFPRFAALVDPKTHVGQTVIRQIENLRMLNAASPGVHANVNSAFRFMLKLPDMQLFYAVLDGDQGRKEIFIGDLKASFDKGEEKAGLYLYDSFSNKYNACKQAFLQERAVYINGQCGGFNDALKKAEQRTGLSKERLAVFYVPGNVVNSLGVWSSASQSQSVKEIGSQLAELIKFNRDKKVSWVPEAEGAEIFSNALVGVNGTVKGHKYWLIDPLTNTPALLETLKAKEIKPSTDEVAPVTYTGQNRAINIYIESRKQAIIDALKMLSAKGNAEYPHQQMVAKLEATAGSAPMSKSKQALTNIAALNPRALTPKSTASAPNKAALSFITALQRV